MEQEIRKSLDSDSCPSDICDLDSRTQINSSRSYRFPGGSSSGERSPSRPYTPTKFRSQYSEEKLSFVSSTSDSQIAMPNTARPDLKNSGICKSVSETRSPRMNLPPQRRPLPALRTAPIAKHPNLSPGNSEDTTPVTMPNSARSPSAITNNENIAPLSARTCDTRAYLPRSLPRTRESLENAKNSSTIRTIPPPLLSTGLPFEITSRSQHDAHIHTHPAPSTHIHTRNHHLPPRPPLDDQSDTLNSPGRAPDIEVSPSGDTLCESGESDVKEQSSSQKSTPRRRPRAPSAGEGDGLGSAVGLRLVPLVGPGHARGSRNVGPRSKSTASPKVLLKRTVTVEPKRSPREHLEVIDDTSPVKSLSGSVGSTMDNFVEPSTKYEAIEIPPLPVFPDSPKNRNSDRTQRARSFKAVTQMIRSPRGRQTSVSTTGAGVTFSEELDKDKTGKGDFRDNIRMVGSKIGELVSPRGEKENSIEPYSRDKNSRSSIESYNETQKSPSYARKKKIRNEEPQGSFQRLSLEKEKEKKKPEKNDLKNVEKGEFVSSSSERVHRHMKRRSISDPSRALVEVKKSQLEKEKKKIEETTMLSSSNSINVKSKAVARLSVKKGKMRSVKKQPAMTTQGMYFGVPLEDSYHAASAAGQMHFAFLCITFIELHGLETEGIFRISGNAGVINEWIKSTDSGKPLVFDENASVHDACGILKIMLLKLLGLLHRVSDNSQINKMTTKNLATCWSLIIFEEPDVTEALSMQKESVDKNEINASGKALLEATFVLNKALVVMIENHVVISKCIKKLIM